MKKQWRIPAVGADFVAAMEDVLEVYAEPYDPKRPKVNFDEASNQLIAETRQSLPAEPGQVARYDYEYERNGATNLFMFVEPQAGWRHVEVTERHTKLDFAQQMKWLVDERYPEAELVRVTLDNLNTHKPASLYEAFEPEEARRIIKKLEFHYTPKHPKHGCSFQKSVKVIRKNRLNGDEGIPLRLQKPARAQPKFSEVSRDEEYSFSQSDGKLVDRVGGGNVERSESAE